LALDPLELATLAGILIVLFLWGPQKIPELARMVGRARKELDGATKQFQNATLGLQDSANPFFASLTSPAPAALPKPGVRSAFPQQPPPPAPVKTGDQLLIETARNLGISTQGKTREQIQQEIISMAQRPASVDPSPAPKTEDTPS